MDDPRPSYAAIEERGVYRCERCGYETRIRVQAAHHETFPFAGLTGRIRQLERARINGEVVRAVSILVMGFLFIFGLWVVHGDAG